MDIVASAKVPKLPRGVKLRFDDARKQWFLLGPERIFEPDEIAIEILQRVDGAKSIGAIAGDLAASFQAPQDEIEIDVVDFVQSLVKIRMLEFADGAP